MALSIRKKSGLLIPKSPTLILPKSIFGSVNHKSESKIIEKTINRFIKEKLGISGRAALRRVIFVPVYKTHNGEKEITKVCMEYVTRKNKVFIDVDDIESTGVTLVEFFDYIITSGAKEIQDPKSALSIM